VSEARVVGALPGPRSRAVVEAERPHLAPGIQQIATLSGLAFDRGEGALLRDLDGNTFIDWVAGVGVASLGHGHPALARAIAEQAARLTSGSFASEVRARLLGRIVRAASAIGGTEGGGPLARVQLYSGGAEAVEAALRLARAHTRRHEVIAFHGGFHGKTLGVLGLMGSSFKHGFGPLPSGCHLSPFPDGRSTAACIEALEEVIALSTTGSLAAILVEPMQGTAGNLIPPPDFLPALSQVARRHGALLIADEMITGWGRTGRLFGVEHSGATPDILVFGKGVAGGYPLSGLMATEAVLRDADPWTRPSSSSSSFGGNPLACAAADAVTRTIVEERLPEHAAEVGAALTGALREIAARHPLIAAVRGSGLMIGVDLTLDRAGCERLFHACLRRGLLTMAYTPRLRINPPLVITRAQALEGAALFDAACDEVGRA